MFADYKVSVKLPSLRECCIKAIAENFDTLVTKCCDCTIPKLTWRFPYPDCAITSPPADMLLKELGDRGILKQEHLVLFSKQHVNLQFLALRDLSLSPSLISVFRDFTLYNITAVNVSGINLSDFISSFSASTSENLHTLNVTNMSIEKQTKLSAMAALGQLQNLHRLNISQTDLDSECLDVLVKSLKRLRYLDVSETNVVNISCLTGLKNSLSELFMNELEVSSRRSFRQMLSTILELKELRTLEVSSLENCVDSRLREVEQLIEPGILPYLEHLEMSGNPFQLTLSDIQKFVANHRKLKFLGLIRFTTRSVDEESRINELIDEYPNIRVFGGIGDIQAVKTLQQYAGRCIYVHHALFYVICAIHFSGYYFPPSFFEFLVNYLEVEHEKSGLKYSAGVLAVCTRIEGENFNDMQTELLERMLNYVLTVIEEEWMDEDDSDGDNDIGEACGNGSNAHDDIGAHDENDGGVNSNGSRNAETAEDEFDERNGEDGENGSDGNDGLNDDNNNDTDLDDDNDFDDDFQFPNISRCLLYIKHVICIDRVVLDYRRCCVAIFNILKHVNTSRTRANAVARLDDMINRMSENEVEEISANPSYMKSLIKCAAEVHLPKKLVDEWLAERNDDRLNYLRDFHEMLTENVDIIGVLKTLVANRYLASKNFISCGGMDVCALILEKVGSNEEMADAAMRLKDVLENVQSLLDSNV